MWEKAGEIFKSKYEIQKGKLGLIDRVLILENIKTGEKIIIDSWQQAKRKGFRKYDSNKLD